MGDQRRCDPFSSCVGGNSDGRDASDIHGLTTEPCLERKEKGVADDFFAGFRNDEVAQRAERVALEVSPSRVFSSCVGIRRHMDCNQAIEIGFRRRTEVDVRRSVGAMVTNLAHGD